MKVKLPLFLTIICIIYFSKTTLSQEIYKYIYTGNYDKIEKWIDGKPNYKELRLIVSENEDSINVNPLTFALIEKQEDIAELIIEKHDSIINYYEWIDQAFGVAVKEGDLYFVKELINHGADVNFYCETCSNVPPIAIALAYRHDNIYKELLKYKANYINTNARYDLIHVASSQRDTLFLKGLIENHKCDVNQNTIYNVTPLMFALTTNNFTNADYLIKKGANTKAKDKSGEYLINYANSLSAFKYAENIHKKDKINFEPKLLIHSIIEVDQKDLFDYFITNYKTQLFKLDDEGDNAYSSLLFTKENTAYFFNQLQENGLEIKDKKVLKKQAKFYKNKNLITLLK